MPPPPFKGGQGREPEDITDTCSAIVSTIIISLILWAVALWAVY